MSGSKQLMFAKIKYLALNSCHDVSDVIRRKEHPTAPEPVPSRVLTCPESVTLSVFVIGASIV